MMRLLRLIFCFGLLFAAPAAVSANDYTDCSILSQSRSEITFSYRPGSPRWASDGATEHLRIPGTAIQPVDGSLPLVGRIVYIALPPGSQSVDAVIIATGESAQFSMTSSSGASNLHAEAVPAPEVDRLVVEGIFTMRGLQVARLVLHPAIAVSPSSYEFMREMTVRVRFDHAGPEGGSSVARNASSPFDVILSEILLNPEAGFRWREQTGIPPTSHEAQETNPFAGSSQWVAIRTRGDGIVTVNGADLRLAGVTSTGLDPRQFRVFAGPGRQLSTRVSDPAPPLTETPLLLTGETDGIFSDGDTFAFWSDGLNRWDVDSLGKLIDIVHRYDRDNVYWLALSHDRPDPPKRLLSLQAPPLPGAIDQFTGIDRVRHEDDNFFRVASSGYIESYYTWYWRNQRRSVITFFNTRNPETGLPAVMEFGTWGGLVGRDPARLFINGAFTLPTSTNLSGGEDRSTIAYFQRSAFDPNADVELFFDSALSDLATSYFLDYYTLEYHRHLDLSAGPFKFAAPDSTATFNFTLANAASVDLWDITDPHNPFLVDGTVIEGNARRFGASTIKGQRRVFYTGSPAARHAPRSITPVQVANLHSPGTSVDYLAIGPRSLQSSTSDFLTYRAGTDALTTRYIATDDICNSFSLGIQDPVAIRRFLKHAHFEWPGEAPVYALLVGDGTNDYLNNTGANSVNFVPPYIVRDDPAITDESFVYFSDRAVLDAEGDTQGNPFPDMLIGRWPVKTPAEVAAVTAKIKRYESAENLGPWRSRIMMVADDEFGDRENFRVREDFHIKDADTIATAYIPSRLDVQKIYLTEYPFDNPDCYNPAASGCTKPSAKEAIIAGLNDGALVFEYIGHGNPDVLAHERVFERVLDIPRLVNDQTPTAVLTFSCSIGFFDDPDEEGMGEEWIRKSQGGAVAVVSPTRIASAFANAALNDIVFDLLFRRGVTGVAAALYTGKLLRQYSEPLCRLFSNCNQLPCPCDNDRGYVLFGDPAMRLGIPTMRVNFTSITPDSLAALALTQVQGTVTDTLGSLQSTFNGTLFVTVRDVPRERIYVIDEITSIDYELPGGTLFRGQVPVTNGAFSFGFVVPKDIAYGQIGARIMGHAVSNTQMANGAADSLRLASSTGVITDTTGPVVRLQNDRGEAIADGFNIPDDAIVSVLISDPSGINLTGSSGHRLLVEVDGQEEPLADLTEAFVYEPGAFDHGTANFPIAGLEQGSHRLTVRAWDNANNSTVLFADIEVIAGDSDIDFTLTEFLNHPNPLADNTTFFFRATRVIREARIRLFTVAGRLIWEAPASDGLTAWDGRDLEGDRVANGVYLAQLEATGEIVATDGQFVDKKAYREMKVVVSR